MNANLADYLVEVEADVPEVTTISVGVSDLAAMALGGKAVGELGIVGVAAIGNAVFHATGRRGRDLPITVQVAPTPDPGPAGLSHLEGVEPQFPARGLGSSLIKERGSTLVRSWPRRRGSCSANF